MCKLNDHRDFDKSQIVMLDQRWGAAELATGSKASWDSLMYMGNEGCVASTANERMSKTTCSDSIS